MHKELSKEFGDAVGYRELTTASIAFDLTSPRRKKLPGADWVNPEAVSKSSKLGGTDTTAQVHPRLLTEQLAKAVNNTVIAQAEEIQYGENGEPTAVLARTVEGKDVKLDCTDVVIATGPWTGRFVKRLFGKDSLVDASDYNITGSRAHSVGHYLSDRMLLH